MTTITVNGMLEAYEVRDEGCMGRECLRLILVPGANRDGSGARRCKGLGDCPSPLPKSSAALRRRRQNDGMSVRP